MRFRTEDLLSIRDGEPIDAALRERLLADPSNRREVERLEHLRDELRRLPLLTPPAGIWDRIEAEAGTMRVRAQRVRADGIERRRMAARSARRYARRARRYARGVRRYSRAAIAAGLAAAVLLLTIRVALPPDTALPSSEEAGRPVAAVSPPSGSGAREPRPGSGAANSTTLRPAGDVDVVARGARPRPTANSSERFVVSYAPLVEESVRLERILARLDPQPTVVNAGTAFTIASLEDRIVLLDEQLTFAAASGADERQRGALWRERVDVMNALVHVRYAQSHQVR